MSKIEQAKQLYKQGKYKEAQRLYDQDYGDLASNDALFGSALCDYEQKKIQASLLKLNQLIESDPGNPLVYNQIGIIAFESGDVETTRIMFNKAIERNPQFEAAYLNLLDTFTQNELRLKIQTIKRYILSFTNSTDILLEGINLIKDNSVFSSELSEFVNILYERDPSNKTIKPLAHLITQNIQVDLEKTQKPLHILFLQNSPCIRNYKYAQALKARGHSVSLAYTTQKLSERYKGLSDDVYKNTYKIINYRDIWDISAEFDLIHSHNEPDTLTVAALAAQCPVIHDTHDLISLRDVHDETIKYFEGIANRGAAGRIYSTSYQKDEAKFLYGVNGRSLVFNNYVSMGDIPTTFLPKLSENDGEIHLVYEGGVGASKHRDFINIFKDIASQGMYIHIYPASYDPKIADLFKNDLKIDYRMPVSPRRIIYEMSQYDFGIIPWNLEIGQKRFLDSTIANKLFEYLAAGLPVFTSNVQSYVDFFRDNPVGMIFNDGTDLKNKIPELKKKVSTLNIGDYVFTYESDIERLEGFYYTLLSSKDNKESEKVDVSSAQTVLENLLGWIRNNGWEGYDPYDVEDFLIQNANSEHPLSEQEKRSIRALNDQDPGTVRQKLNIPAKINAKAMGLMLSAYSRLYRVSGEAAHLEEAKKIADWLLDNTSKGYKNKCWGYPFDWQSKIFIPKDTPSVVVSVVIGDGFWDLFQATKDKKYLDVCQSICSFILTDLKKDSISKDVSCFSYTPIDDFHVHNANLFAAEFLVRIGQILENQTYVDEGLAAGQYALSEQNPDGSIFYWGQVQNYHSPNHLDCYHSGFEIRKLYALYKLTNLKKYKRAYEQYLQFFLDQFYSPDGRVTQMPRTKGNNQVNIHGLAEGLLLFATLQKDHPNLSNFAYDILTWAQKHIIHPEGWFGYQYRNRQAVMFPFLRWGQAWMFLALAELLLTEPKSSLLSNEKISRHGTTKPKICHVGGAHSVHVADLVEELDKLGYEQCILSYMPIEQSITPRTVPVYYYPYRDFPASVDQFGKMETEIKSFLSHVFQKEKPNIVHGHSLTYSAFTLHMVQKQFNLKTVVTPWSTHTLKVSSPVENYAEKLCLQGIDKVLYGSKYIYDLFKDYYQNISDEQFVLFRPLLPFRLYEKERQISTKPRILSSRVMSQIYRQDLLIKAIPALIEQYPELEITFLIGQHAEQGKTYFGQMKKLAEKFNIMDHCKFISRSLSKEEFAEEIYSHNIVYAVSSHDEGYSGSATLAMYSGAITIVQKTPENETELIHDKNLLKVELTENDIQNTLKYALDNLEDLQNRFIKNNQFLNKFSEKKMMQNVTKTYQELVIKN